MAGVEITTHGLTTISRLSFAERLLSIPAIITHYITRFVFPVRLLIAEHWVITEFSLIKFWLPLIFSLIIFALLIWRYLYKPSKQYLFFALWFILGLGLHLQLYPLDMTVADRWFYFPLAGLLGLFLVIIKSLFPRLHKLRSNLLFLFFVVLTILSIRSFTRVLNWHDGLTLYSHDYQFNDSAFDLTNNLGVEYFRVGKLDQAAQLFQHSIQLAPHWWTSYNNLGAYYQHQGDLQLAEKLYRQSILNGDYYLAYENLAMILYQQEKWVELAEFLPHALTRYPNNQLFLDLLNL